MGRSAEYPFSLLLFRGRIVSPIPDTIYVYYNKFITFLLLKREFNMKLPDQYTMKKPIYYFCAFVIFCIIIAITVLDRWNDIGNSALEILPFLFIIVFARLSPRYKILRPVSLLGAVMVTWGIAFITCMIMILPLGSSGEGIFHIPDTITPAETSLLFSSLLTCTIGAILASLPVFGRVRRWISHFLPIDPDSCPHAVCLIIILGLLLMFIPTFSLGHPALANMLDNPKFAGIATTLNSSNDIFSLLWMIFFAFIAVGLFIERTPAECMKRLGLKWPKKEEFALSLAFGLVMVPVFFIVDSLIRFLFLHMGLPLTDEHYLSALFSGFLTIPGIIIGSLSAGIGEELSMRGLLQPCLGLLLTSVVFAAMHAYQYNFDALISVFLIGIIFGLIRNRYNTIFCATSHSVYDFILMALMVLGITW